MSNSEEWTTTPQQRGLIGERLVKVLATRPDTVDGGTSATCILFTYEEPASDAIYALRWSLGAVLDLGTNDLQTAMGAINTMITLEASDDED